MLSQVVNNSKMRSTNYRNHAIVFIQRHPCLTLMCISSVLSCVVFIFIHMFPYNTYGTGDMITHEARIITGIRDIPACDLYDAYPGKIWSSMKVTYI